MISVVPPKNQSKDLSLAMTVSSGLYQWSTRRSVMESEYHLIGVTGEKKEEKEASSLV